jgi:uncharacterized protein involved in exopolysaccharide biosynthesis
MHNQTHQSGTQKSNLTELFSKFRQWVVFIKSNWKKILFFALLTAFLGFFYAKYQPVKYISKLTFVVVENKSGGGGLSSLAGQFGIDLGSGSSGGVFSADNILLFLRSKSLIRETLLSPYNDSSNLTLADKFSEITGKKKQWRKNTKIGEIDFSKFRKTELPRIEDSLLQKIIKDILERNLLVSRPDKKATFIEVKAELPDELLSKLFVDRLVHTAANRYIDSRSKTKMSNIEKLENRADSLSAVLNDKIYLAASTQQSLVDVNPALRMSSIASEISSRDKAMAATLYAEVVKNLELSKTLLSQDMPVIEIIDNSSFPLEVKRTGKIMTFVLGGFIGAFLVIFVLTLRLLLKKIL